MDLLVTGIILSVLGNTFIAIGLFTQRYAHTVNNNNTAYFYMWTWWLGLILYLAGEVGNFLAYGMAPITVVAPLGIISIIVNVPLSLFVLHEHITWVRLGGSALAMAGGVLVVIHAPSSNQTLYNSIVTWTSLVYFFILIALALYIANPLEVSWALSHTYAQAHVYVYSSLCGLSATFAVTSSKIISSAIINTYSGNSAMFTQADIAWLTYLFLIVLIIAGLTQIHFLNKALSLFQSTEVVPINYIILNTLLLLTGIVVFNEVHFSPLIPNVVLFVLGLLLAYTGVYLVSKSSNQQIEPKINLKLII